MSTVYDTCHYINILLQNVIQVFCAFYLSDVYNIYDWHGLTLWDQAVSI